MIYQKYNNKKFHHSILKEFIEGRKTALELQIEYWKQRDKDADQDIENGYDYGIIRKNLKGAEKEFEEKYSDKLYEKA